jgi:hypothetical protein
MEPCKNNDMRTAQIGCIYTITISKQPNLHWLDSFKQTCHTKRSTLLQTAATCTHATSTNIVTHSLLIQMHAYRIILFSWIHRWCSMGRWCYEQQHFVTANINYELTSWLSCWRNCHFCYMEDHISRQVN